MTILAAYQGIEGSHSSVLLPRVLGELGATFELQGLSSFRAVATAVISGKADVGFLPIDDAIAGTVRDAYDLLGQYELLPLRELEVHLDQRLLGFPGAEPSTIREIFAHPLVIRECGRFLATLPGARVTPTEDTGGAAKTVSEAKDPTRAAIAPPEAAALYGLVELAGNLADHPDATTRFLLFAAPSARGEVLALGRRGGPRRTSLLLSTEHQKGALAQCLSAFAAAGLNLTKLESRPKLGKPGEFLFYVDLDGDSEDEGVRRTLDELRGRSLGVQLIGSYDIGPPTRASSPALVAPSPRVQGGEPVLPAVSASYPKASRTSRSGRTRVRVGEVELGGDEFVVVAGPCSVESREQVMATATHVAAHGAKLLRGGAFKPRTNPYAFQGLGWEGVALLAEAGRATGLPTVSEVMSIDQVERMAREVDVLQIGARNMQNFDLLKAVGKTDRPVLLKRGLSASLDELLAAAEYILAEGNPNVALCERGIRTFETATRNTLDLSAVPVLRERTHLPVLVDPSHGVGVRRWIRPLCRAAKAVGAHAILIEVHPKPEEAKSDKEQALTFDDFDEIMNDLAKIPYEG